jgi:guanosine-3',5'-bis(diphosphate) 3'-pyrophosphohydrolase
MGIEALREMQGLLEAAAFAARAHRHQLRKDGQTPYLSHVVRVCLIVRHLFQIEDPRVLAAALLHDCIEDTPTDYDDLASKFGEQVADWVAILSKDMRLPEAAREAAYEARLCEAPWQVKACKLADILDNLLDAAQLDENQRRRTLARCRRYLDVLVEHLPNEVRPAYHVVRETLDQIAAGVGG